jgi:ATP-dependent Zn protease
MSEIEQRLPRRVGTAAGGRRVFLRWKLILPLALVLAAVVVAAPLLFPRHSDVQTLTYSELVSAIGAGRVESVEIGSGDVVRGRFAGATVAAEAEFMTIYQPALAENLIQRAQEAGVAVSFERAPNTERYRVGSMVLLQVLLFAGIGYFIYMQTRGAVRR